MKKAFFIPVILIVLLSLACSLGGYSISSDKDNGEAPAATDEPLVQPVEENQAIPTTEPSPTSAPQEPTEKPTVAPPTLAPSGPVYFREEFDGSSDSWIFEYITGNTQEQCIGPSFEAGRLSWSCRAGEETGVKVYNLDYNYSDVVVQAEVENFASNSARMALLCRVSEKGWYEFRFSANGIFEVYRFDWSLKDAGQTPYVFIGNGATALIIPGKTTNTVAMDCSGKNFRFYANGSEIELKLTPTQRDEFTRLESGGVGLGFMVASDSPGPVDVGFNWFETRAP